MSPLTPCMSYLDARLSVRNLLIASHQQCAYGCVGGENDVRRTKATESERFLLVAIDYPTRELPVF